VRGRGEEGWLRVGEVQQQRLLEVNFVDVGQGDGAFIVTPDDQFALIDAGASDHMRRFLSWRFNLKLDRIAERGDPHEVGRRIHFVFAVISHADLDHYEGFRDLFESPAFRFRTVYHNALVERPAASDTLKLGARGSVAGRTCVTGLIETPEQLAALLDSVDARTRARYVTLLRTAIGSGRVARIVGLTTDAGDLHGFGATHCTRDGKPLRLEVVAPIALADGARRGLPWFSNLGKTKNGHSVVLRLQYGSVKLLLGGDLNVPAEEHLLASRAGAAPAADALPVERATYLAQIRAAFGADVAKACHHGSADFTTDFLRAINAAATVISSGDDEPYCHPRPDTLGAIGRYGRGERPLIFSTELARSTREYTRPLQAVQDEIRAAIAELTRAAEADRAAIERRIDQLLDRKERNVAVYGLIMLRTDGTSVLLAQKLERPRSATGEEFDLQWLAPDASGELAHVRGESD
jgi:beta-lactamase superfamily II metal-dependent hydrolase